jgi:hypothetical protein
MRSRFLPLAQLLGVDRQAFLGAKRLDQHGQHSVFSGQQVVELVDGLGEPAHHVERRRQRAPDPPRARSSRQPAPARRGSTRGAIVVRPRLWCASTTRRPSPRTALEQQEFLPEAAAAAHAFRTPDSWSAAPSRSSSAKVRAVVRSGSKSAFGEGNQPLLRKIRRFAERRKARSRCGGSRREIGRAGCERR